jgi:gamma-glutamyltranspeptidase/glutathione hydrolase
MEDDPMMTLSLRRSALLAMTLLAAMATMPAFSQALAPAPEAATGRIVKTAGTAQRYMVAAANPLAAEAGRTILRQGGSAVDAAIAIQLVLNLVEPQSSGIGGGAFMVHWDETAKKISTLDGRETAPAAATPNRFLGPDGKSMKFQDAVVGGRSVGVPGTLKLLEGAHQRWGKLPWAEVIAPAIKLAEDGFTISPRLNGLLSRETSLAKNALAAAYFYEPDGKAKAVGTLLRNPAFAATLRAIAEKGSEIFYAGPIAEDIVATVTGHPTNPGDITLADLATYKIVEREPVCGAYRVWRICGMGPPSSGAIAIQQMLGILETQNLARMGAGAQAAHWISEAGRLAFADRNLYVADPAFLSIPVTGLIDRDYVRSRAGLVSPDKSMGRAKPGDPPHKRAQLLAPSDGIEHGTSHISVIDGNGDAVSMTTTIEDGFGSRLMTKGGFLLNNELTDFSFLPEEDGKPVANRVEGGKRPRSSMAPTLVFDAFGRLYAVVGSPGGSQIIGFVAKTLVALLDWKMDPQNAVDLANFGSRNGPTELEASTEAAPWKAALEAKGHEVRLLEMTSGIQAIVKTPEGFIGGADGRREGVAIGD